MLANYSDFIQDQIDAISASIQSRVAQFLAQKSQLVNLKRSSSSAIASRASQLYDAQVLLEQQLSENLKTLDKMKVSGYTLAGLTSIGIFAHNMESQMSEVNLLSDQARGVAPVPSQGFPWGWAFFGVTGFILIGAAFRRK